MQDEKLKKYLSTMYEDVRYINGMYCGLERMLFTFGVQYGLDAVGVKGRFCFDTRQNAELFYKEWDGVTMPTVGVDGCTALKGNPPPQREVKQGKKKTRQH